VDMPLTDFINRCFRVSIITSIALSGGLYQQDIIDFITNLPSELSGALIDRPLTDQQLKNIMNRAAEEGFMRASEAFEESAFLNADGFLYGIFGVLILITTSCLVAIGGAFILLAKIALALLVGLGPFFIVALLWHPTHRFFEKWATQLLSYIILVVLLAFIFGFMIDIFANYMQDMKFDGRQNVSCTLGGSIVLSIISVVFLLKMSSIANALAKGISFEHLWKSGARSGR
uniref:type IV secretion system protein n=1 Tax=Bartonella sp. CB178 TaxID=3112255 RepID=UPI00300E153A